MNESAAHHQNRFMTDLTQAMRSIAETARLADIEQCQTDAKTYVEQLQARTLDETEELRQAAEADVATIRERSRVRVERIRQETEQRMSRRRELLDQELEEFHAAVELEIESVQERVEAFQSEVSKFFEQLLQGADPTVFATMASKMPDAPVFADLDREAFASELRAKHERAQRAERGEPADTAEGGPCRLQRLRRRPAPTARRRRSLGIAGGGTPPLARRHEPTRKSPGRRDSGPHARRLARRRTARTRCGDWLGTQCLRWTRVRRTAAVRRYGRAVSPGTSSGVPAGNTRPMIQQSESLRMLALDPR